jgi:hypothetical protein
MLLRKNRDAVTILFELAVYIPRVLSVLKRSRTHVHESHRLTALSMSRFPKLVHNVPERDQSTHPPRRLLLLLKITCHEVMDVVHYACANSPYRTHFR